MSGSVLDGRDSGMFGSTSHCYVMKSSRQKLNGPDGRRADTNNKVKNEVPCTGNDVATIHYLCISINLPKLTSKGVGNDGSKF